MSEEKKYCSIRLPKEIHSLAKLEAYRSGLTLQDWILQMIKMKLNL